MNTRASTDNATDAAIYREAARHVADVKFKHEPPERPQHKACCTALADVGASYEQEAMFRDFFRPEGAGSFWFGRVEDERNRPARVLALCFMAAIAEAGDA